MPSSLFRPLPLFAANPFPLFKAHTVHRALNGLKALALATAGLLSGAGTALAQAVPAMAPVAAPAPSAPIVWRMGTSWPTSLPLLHESAVDFADTVRLASGGRLSIAVVDPGQHRKPAGLLQAVKDGEFDLAHTTAQYYAEAIPAIDFFTAVPFGFTAIENHAWLNEGGGQALFEEILAPHNILPLAAGDTAVQMGGWFAKPLRGPEDLRGVRIRVAGFPGRVLGRAGAVPVNLPLGQIASAFAEGKIDAADVVGPAVDATLPLAQYAPYYYAPWHEPDVVLHLLINRSKFLALPADLQHIVRQSAAAAALRSIARAQDRNAVAARELEARGTRILPLPASVIQVLKDATAQELQRSAQGNADAARVISSLTAYRNRVVPYSMQSDGLVFNTR